MKYVLLMIIGYVFFGSAIALLGVALWLGIHYFSIAILGVTLGILAIIFTTLKMNLLRDIFIWANKKREYK